MGAFAIPEQIRKWR